VPSKYFTRHQRPYTRACLWLGLAKLIIITIRYNLSCLENVSTLTLLDHLICSNYASSKFVTRVTSYVLVQHMILIAPISHLNISLAINATYSF